MFGIAWILKHKHVRINLKLALHYIVVCIFFKASSQMSFLNICLH